MPLKRFATITALAFALLPAVEARGGCRSGGGGCAFRQNPRYDSYWPRRAGVLHHHHRSGGGGNLLYMLESLLSPNSVGNTNTLMRQSQRQQQEERRSPRYDVEETDDAYELVMEVPGVSAKDLVVELDDNTVLRVHATRSRDFGVGKMVVLEQSFTLQDVDTERITVSLSDGILRITAPKREHEVVRLKVVQPTKSTPRSGAADEVLRPGKTMLERMLRKMEEEEETRPESPVQIIDVVESASSP